MNVQTIYDRLNSMELSESARDVIAATDQGGIELFAGCETAEDVEQIISEYFQEAE